METLAARIEWVLAHTRDPKGGTWTAKSLSLAAGLSPAHVGMIRRGTAKKVTGETLEAIARTAGVSYRWLGTGKGSPGADEDAAVSPSRDATDPVFLDTPQWAALRTMAKALDPGIEDWALDIVAQSHPLRTAPMTAGMVRGMARVVMELMPPPATAVAATQRKAR